MFEILADADDSKLINVMYHVGLRMYERHLFDDRETRRERMLAAFGRDLSPELIDTVEGVIGEIETREGKPLRDLTDQQTVYYHEKLDEMYASRTEPPSAEIVARAERTLAEIREQYGYAA
ncbi:MAG TPA: hypothetical protein VFS20_34130 [Longimicrobium sp.]|nr:hypothetical protein [Longimicrobium sp.]